MTPDVSLRRTPQSKKTAHHTGGFLIVDIETQPPFVIDIRLAVLDVRVLRQARQGVAHRVQGYVVAVVLHYMAAVQLIDDRILLPFDLRRRDIDRHVGKDQPKIFLDPVVAAPVVEVVVVHRKLLVYPMPVSGRRER